LLTGAPGRGGQDLALATLCTLLLLTFLDNTVVSVALGDVQASLHAGVTELQWVVGAYALTFASLMLGLRDDRPSRSSSSLPCTWSRGWGVRLPAGAGVLADDCADDRLVGAGWAVDRGGRAALVQHGRLPAVRGWAVHDRRLPVLAPALAALAASLGLVGLGIGTTVVPITSTVLSAVPAECSGMAASATNISREIGAVTGVAILGSVAISQLHSSLTAQLNHLGIRARFQALVINAIETGAVPQNTAAE
jgi:MFS family permease